jgi:hypothetical protein
MPKRISRAAKARALARKPALEALASTTDVAFQEGDVVVAADDSQRVGRVCRVVTAGRSYQVRFADSPGCMLTPHGAIVPAPPTIPGPACTPDC